MNYFSSLKYTSILRLTILVVVLLIGQSLLVGAHPPNNSLDAADGNPQSAVFVDANGYVGIGSKTPKTQLHVYGTRASLQLPAAEELGHNVLLDSNALLLLEQDTVDLADNISTSTSELRLKAKDRNTLIPATEIDESGWFTGTASIRVDVSRDASSRNLTLAAESADMPITFETQGIEKVRIASNGNLGIGTFNPQGALHILTTGLPPSDLPSEENGLLLGVESTSGYKWIQSYGGKLSLNPQGNNVGIGTSDPQAKLTVVGNVAIETETNTPNVEIRNQFSDENTGAWMSLNDNGQERIALAALNGTTNVGGLIDVKNQNGQNTVRIMGDTGDGSGSVTTSVLEITGGSDLAELFEVAGTDTIEPGMVVVIDPDNPGQLRIANQAYDRTVAGVISGAGGLSPGLTLQQKDTIAEGNYPITLTGRVYVWVDESNGAIQPGDLLTTSYTPGHAMKVTNYERAQGAILGKAMTSLEAGRGLVLVLVSLQ